MPVKNWQKKITVDKRIVRLLSSSTYEDFPGALKEIVSNSYDADATEVNIDIDLKQDKISIVDNGNGMTPDEFEFFLRIAGQQRGRSASPIFGRERIGQFGIGFMAIFPFGKKISVLSSARGSDIQFDAKVPTEFFIKEGYDGISVNVEDIPIPGKEISGEQYLAKHGTEIVITGLTEMVHRFFSNVDQKYYKKRETVKKLAPMKRLKWILCEDLPIEYPKDSTFQNAFPMTEDQILVVNLNDKKLYRNVHANQILEKESWSSKSMMCRYVIATDWFSVRPFEARGLKLRLKNVGIGKRRKFGLGTEGRAYSRLHWLTGEIHILNGFDNLLTIDRKGFRESTEYDEFFEYFRSRMSHFSFYLENVATAKRDIERQIVGQQYAEVDSRKSIIDKNIKKLKSKGFEIKKTFVKKGSSSKSPVRVDFNRKVVEVVEDHPELSDKIVINDKELSVRYKQWEYESKSFGAVRKAKDGIIEINTNYPLFKSRRYGDFFKRIMIILLLAIDKSNDKNKLLPIIMDDFLSEFEDIN